MHSSVYQLRIAKLPMSEELGLLVLDQLCEMAEEESARPRPVRATGFSLDPFLRSIHRQDQAVRVERTRQGEIVRYLASLKRVIKVRPSNPHCRPLAELRRNRHRAASLIAGANVQEQIRQEVEKVQF